jgi:hypothetical protein
MSILKKVSRNGNNSTVNKKNCKFKTEDIELE